VKQGDFVSLGQPAPLCAAAFLTLLLAGGGRFALERVVKIRVEG
jgi:hypothetical protein